MAAHALTITNHFIREMNKDNPNLHNYVMMGIGAMGFCTFTGGADDEVWRKLYDWADGGGTKEELKSLLDLSLDRHSWMKEYNCYEDIDDSKKFYLKPKKNKEEV